MNIRRIYEYALLREHEGLHYFSQQAERAGHGAVTSVFRRLAEEERAHIRYLESLIARLDAGDTPCVTDTDGLAEGSESFFQARAASEMIEQTTAEAMVPDLPVLRMAYLIERDLAEFYRSAADRLEGEAGRALGRLADWETEHEKLFKELHDRIFAEYAEMPWGG